MGSGWWRADPESHMIQTAPPHSEYVTEYLRVGTIGLFLLTFFLFGPLIALCRARKESIDAIYPCNSIWVVVVSITLVYGITYSIEPESYALLGIASSIALRGGLAKVSSASDEIAQWKVDSAAEFSV
jgi:O-antigen ligase